MWIPIAVGQMMTFIPVVAPMIMMGIAIALFGVVLITILEWIPKILKIALSIFDPEVFLRDLIFALFSAVTMILSSVLGTIKEILITIVNKLGFSDDIFGLKPKKGKKSCRKGVKCIRPTLFRLIVLVICPPLAVFLQKGLSAWINIIFCIALTLMFYVPGLIYASLLILC